MVVLLIAAVLLVAFANGANDNAKGVATLVGSRMAALKPALTWANLTTFLGAVAAIPMALYVNTELVKAFGGSGLLPKGVPITDAYLAAVGVGAALTVLLATRLGIPVSTTHGLMGALIGAGLVAVGPGQIVWSNPRVSVRGAPAPLSGPQRSLHPSSVQAGPRRAGLPHRKADLPLRGEHLPSGGRLLRRVGAGRHEPDPHCG